MDSVSFFWIFLGMLAQCLEITCSVRAHVEPVVK